MIDTFLCDNNCICWLSWVCAVFRPRLGANLCNRINCLQVGVCVCVCVCKNFIPVIIDVCFANYIFGIFFGFREQDVMRAFGAPVLGTDAVQFSEQRPATTCRTEGGGRSRSARLALVSPGPPQNRQQNCAPDDCV